MKVTQLTHRHIIDLSMHELAAEDIASLAKGLKELANIQCDYDTVHLYPYKQPTQTTLKLIAFYMLGVFGEDISDYTEFDEYFSSSPRGRKPRVTSTETNNSVPIEANSSVMDDLVEEQLEDDELDEEEEEPPAKKRTTKAKK